MTGTNAGAWAQEQLDKRDASGNWDWNDFRNELGARFLDPHDKQYAQ